MNQSVENLLGIRENVKNQTHVKKPNNNIIISINMNKKIKFTGNFWEYFLISIGLMILSIITFGLLLPYWMYWSLKYFFTRLEIIEP